MANNLKKAEWWKEFILSRCQYPSPEILRAQFDAANLVEFCECGCNSFKVEKRSGETPPALARGGGYGGIFEAAFKVANSEDGTMEIILFAGEDGNLAYVEIDYCTNTFPVPDLFSLEEVPYHVHASAVIVV